MMLSVKIEGDSVTKKAPKKRKFVIEDVIMKNKARVEPLFVDFANGRPIDSSALTATLHQNASGEARRKRRRVLTVPTENLSYAGTNFGADTRRGDTTTFLGVLDKRTGKMRLIETSTYCMRPILSSTQKSPKHALLGDSIHSQSYMAKQEVMVSAFGSKRAKVAVNRKKQYQVDAENMSSAIDQAAQVAVVKDIDELIWEKQEGQPDSLQAILPPCDREATRHEDVYKLEDLAPDSFLAHLEDSAWQLLETRYPDESYSQLVIELLSNTKLEVNEEKRLKLCSIILYIHHLLCFLRLKYGELNKVNVLENCPYTVSQYMFREFTTGKKPFRSRTSLNEDRVTCLILVLSLIINKYELSFDILLMSLPLTRDRLGLIMKIIGATYSPSNQLYVLKLPLAKVCRQHIKLGRREKKKQGRI